MMPCLRTSTARLATSPYAAASSQGRQPTNVRSATTGPAPIIVRSTPIQRAARLRPDGNVRLQCTMAELYGVMFQSLLPTSSFENIRDSYTRIWGEDTYVTNLDTTFASLTILGDLGIEESRELRYLRLDPNFDTAFQLEQPGLPTSSCGDATQGTDRPQHQREVALANSALNMWTTSNDIHKHLHKEGRDGKICLYHLKEAFIGLVVRLRILVTCMERSFLRDLTAHPWLLAHQIKSALCGLDPWTHLPRASVAIQPNPNPNPTIEREMHRPPRNIRPIDRDVHLSPSSPTVSSAGASADLRSALDRRIRAVQDTIRTARRDRNASSLILGSASTRPPPVQTRTVPPSSPLRDNYERSPASPLSPISLARMNRHHQQLLTAIPGNLPSSSPRLGVPPLQRGSPVRPNDGTIHDDDNDSESGSSHTTATVPLGEDDSDMTELEDDELPEYNVDEEDTDSEAEDDAIWRDNLHQPRPYAFMAGDDGTFLEPLPRRPAASHRSRRLVRQPTLILDYDTPPPELDDDEFEPRDRN